MKKKQNKILHYGLKPRQKIYEKTENFDPITSNTTQKKVFRKFWKNGILFRSRSVEDWVKCMQFDRNLRDFVIPRCIERFIFEKAIDKQQGETLKQMIQSSDREDWTLAMIMLKQLKPKKRK